MTKHLRNIFGLILALVLLAALSIGAAAQIEGRSEGDALGRKTPSVSAERAESDFPPATVDPDTSLESLKILLIPLTEDDLAALAAEWRAMLKAHVSKLADLQVVVSSGKDTESEAARKRWLQLTNDQKTLFNKYAAVLGSGLITSSRR